MFTPLELRPLLPTESVAIMMDMPLPKMRSMCLHYDIPLYEDAVFGELITVNAFHRLLRAQRDPRASLRTDSSALLVMLALAKGMKAPLGREILPYSKRIENEIDHISRMTEPARTLRAISFWKAYRAAKTVAGCLRGYDNDVRSLEARRYRVEIKCDRVEKFAAGKRKRWSEIGKKPKKVPPVSTSRAGSSGAPSASAS